MTTSLFDQPLSGDDPAYKNLKKAGTPEQLSIRKYVEELWAEWEPCADPNFCREIQDNFTSRFWEMYLGVTLKRRFGDVSSGAKGPDICVNCEGQRIWVEAVAPDSGAPGHPDTVVEPQAGEGGWVPEEKIVLRLTTSIAKKCNKYRQYLAAEMIGRREPYIIAVNPSKLAYSWAETDPPRILSAVYPLGHHYVTLDRQTLEVVNTGRQYRPEIKKASGAGVPTTFFLNPEYEAIGGVIYANLHAGHQFPPSLNYLTYVHNHCAKNPVPEAFSAMRREYALIDHGDSYEVVDRQATT